MTERHYKPNNLVETLNPKNTPEMGFQSYDVLGDSKETRAEAKRSFIAGEVLNPQISYPQIDVQTLEKGIHRLDSILALAQEIDDEEVRSAVWNSAGYRMAEMHWLLSSVRLHEAIRSNDAPKIDKTATEFQELNEILYDTSPEEERLAVQGEIWNQINEKALTSRGSEIKEELTSGFSVTLKNGERVVVPGLEFVEGKLDFLNAEVLKKLEKYLRDKFKHINDLIEEYYNEVILKRDEGLRHFTPEDLLIVFEQVHAMYDPENTSGVTIEFKDGATALSWETSRMAVVIGSARKPVSSVNEVFGLVVHEYLVHGGRAIEGSKTSIPVLGTGLFTEADKGESFDYLTYEEGFASICQIAINANQNRWKPVDLEKTLAIQLADKGYSFRQCYETLWRVRVLMLSKSGIDIEQKSIELAQRNAYDSCLRVYRGTPINLERVTPDGDLRVLTYNKDLSYLRGKQKAGAHLVEIIDDTSELEKLFMGKYDPTNKRQKAIFDMAQSATIKG